MWWSVRAIDAVAAAALSGVVAVGGLYAFTTPPADPAPAGVSYPTGDVSTETVRSAPYASPSPKAPTGKESERPTERERATPPPSQEPPASQPSGTQPPAAPPAGTGVAAPDPSWSAPEGWSPVELPPTSAPTGAELVVSSFNVLGTSHTRHGERGFAPGVVRAQYAAQLIRQHQVDIVGFQELQPDQRGVMTRALGEYDIWPGGAVTQGHAWVNSIMWRADKWQAVQSSTTPIPYFKGQIYQMPYVRLRNLQTGAEVWVANFHNPASTKRSGNNARWREEALRRQIVLANELYGETGVPVIFTGDMNEREDYFCPFVGQTALEASNGGSVEGTRCDVPDNPRIDWIFGTPEIQWLSSVADRSDLVQRTTDHPMIVARGRLTPPTEGTE